MNKYPFKFLDSYNASDKDIFFGRDDEIKTLYEMVFQNSMVLVYGASGTGKTSLIQCGLSSKFKSYDWMPLMVRRGNNINDALKKTLKENGGNYAGDDEEKTAVQKSGISKLIEGVYLTNFKPIYLIFDQFEELYILGKKDEQELFTAIIKEILLCEQPVKMIFSIRDEYLGFLYEFEIAVPQLMRKKLRVEPMTIDKVADVLTGINKYKNSNVHIKDDELTQITDSIFKRLNGKGKTLPIQLPFLQVFLDKFYLKITGDESRTAEAVFTMQALNEMGEIGDVLINFLDEQVTSISKNLKAKFPDLTPEIIWRMLSPFSTIDGTKEPISKSGLSERLTGVDSKLIDEIVTAFTNSRILRYNDATDMYEIAHDALAKPISEKRSVEEKTLLEIKRLIKSQVAVKAEAREYFTERQLVFIDSYLDKIKISDEEKDWIIKSRAYNLKKKETAAKEQLAELGKKRKQKFLIQGIVTSIVIAIGAFSLLVYAVNQSRLAKIQTILAKQETKRAQDEKKKAEDYAKKIEESIKLSSYGLSQKQISRFETADFKRTTELTEQINLLKNQIDKSFTIQYYQKFNDEDKAIGILKDLGYKLNAMVAQPYMKNAATKCIWIGDHVNNKIDNVKIIALCLMRSGVKLQAIRLLNNPANNPDLIQIGGDLRIDDNYRNNPVWTFEQIMNLKSGDIDRIGKAK